MSGKPDSRRWRTFRLLCDLLSPVLKPGASPAIPAATEWNQLLEAASHHLVTPTIAWSLRGRDEVPTPLARYFEKVLALMRARNADALDAIEAIGRALNAAGIEPVLLKGPASLVEGLYPDPGVRVLSDIDLLVPPPDAMHAFLVLEAAGFLPREPVASAKWFRVEHHHLPMQVHPRFKLGVEVHRRVLPIAHDAIVPVQECLAGARALDFRGCRVRIPDPADRIAHNIGHSQLADGEHRTIPRLRQLLELAMLQQRHGEAVDWRLLARRFEAGGAAPVLAETLALSRALFGQAMPASLAIDSAPVLARLERNVTEPDRVVPIARRRLLLSRAQRLLANPLALLNLLQPVTWRERRLSWSRRLRQRRW